MKPQVSKEIVVAGLVTDEHGNVLIVKPSHKDGWIFPGGYVEVGESPSAAFVREMQAELGVTVPTPPRLLSIDYRGITEEYLMLVFDGGVFTPGMIAQITLPPSLTDVKFVSPETALTMLRANTARRLLPALHARATTGAAYIEY